MYRQAIFRLHQYQIAIAEPVVPESTQRRARAIPAEEIGSERLESAASAERVQHVKRHIAACIRRREEAVQCETVAGLESRNPLLDFSFPSVKVVTPGIVIPHSLERNLIRAAVTVGLIGAAERLGARVRQFDESSISAERRFGS
jgi:hypothetical protein